ncbi:penicillin-binding protein 2 [Andreprevotia lacus DSM 23236]|jgi:penicillin-binding protein 2|uniref:Peptidoglycan D,D-transpeptidase MrdA n=1 Tax=Andreprevotia lacus DSM 23236 TaxID=1121001 RepID=A0A1W1X4T3_9NEIS|nr:penicillin-binding protein 2 [Andreprevotia lacus]SMC18471.1 penicillin-binding protein 2 [Andreprevotia lacus DSM 23236]
MKYRRRTLFSKPVKGRMRPPSTNELKNANAERYAFQLRIVAAALFVLALFGCLLARFVWLQTLQHDKYQTMAEANRISLVPVQPSRGIIKDRNGVVLAHNYSAYTLEITPSKLPDSLEQSIERLNKIIEVTPKDRRRFKKLMDETKEFESLPIKTRLSDEEVARFAANSYQFPGIEVKARLFRHYPLGELASHLIGYIGRINDKDLADLEDAGETANYRGTDHIGKVGIEQFYESQLHGTTGFEEVEIDSGGRAIRTLRRTQPKPGQNLVLSVDIKLQEIAENAFGDNNGSLVAIDPKTGGILALVSKPGYDPNLFVDGIDPQNWKDLNESPDKPLNNRALRGTYPPGSTFKPFMALAALEGGFRSANAAIADPGFFWFGGHQFRDDKAGGHGMVDMYRSIVVSCDTYYYSLANTMGIDNISRFMKLFDFGQPTGVDIQGEQPGVLPSQEWKKKRFKNPAQQKWFAGETISVGIGQGYNTYTPLQMAHATATLANDGVMFKPHLVQFIEDADKGSRTVVEPMPVKTIPLKPENLAVIHRAMAGVVKEGTGAKAFAGAQYEAAGKTGTAQVFSLKGGKYSESGTKKHLRDHAWFIAYAPANDPKIALAVLVENGGFGAATAAPIARQVLDYYLTGKKPNAPAINASDVESSGDD